MPCESVEQFVLLFDAAFPEWLIGPHVGQERRCLAFEIPAPSAAIGTLAISVTKTEVVLQLHTAPESFSNFTEGVEAIRAIADERSVLEAWYSGPYLRKAGLALASERPNPYPMRGITRVTRRSWRGTHDADLKIS